MPDADEAALAQQAQVRHDVGRRRRFRARLAGLGRQMPGSRFRLLDHSP
jgi:hypothetical protein